MTQEEVTQKGDAWYDVALSINPVLTSLASVLYCYLLLLALHMDSKSSLPQLQDLLLMHVGNLACWSVLSCHLEIQQPCNCRL